LECRDQAVTRLFALIPAAGKSRRMGQPKLLLRLGDRTILEHVCRAVKLAGVERVVVVVGPDGCALVPLAESAGADVLQLDDDTAEMRHTILHGLSWLQTQCQPRPDDAWLLLPADHPCVEPDVIVELSAAHAQQPERSIVVPTYQGQRGHPVLIGWEHLAAIRHLPEGTGLNAYLRQHPGRTLELPVSRPSILWDLDTPEDYHRLLNGPTSPPHTGRCIV
jgi:molybdenum cofactor cytidylyltransferase